MSFVIYSCKTGKCWNQNVFTNLQNFVKFWEKSRNSPNIAKSNRVFPGKARGDRALVLTYLDSAIAEVFHRYCLPFSISTIFEKNEQSKLDEKSKLWVRPFMKTRILQIFFKQCFCLLEYNLWWEFWQYYIMFGGERAQKPPKKSRGTQNFENF